MNRLSFKALGGILSFHNITDTLTALIHTSSSEKTFEKKIDATDTHKKFIL